MTEHEGLSLKDKTLLKYDNNNIKYVGTLKRLGELYIFVNATPKNSLSSWEIANWVLYETITESEFCLLKLES